MIYIMLKSNTDYGVKNKRPTKKVGLFTLEQ
jgi:hypothetical protein